MKTNIESNYKSGRCWSMAGLPCWMVLLTVFLNIIAPINLCKSSDAVGQAQTEEEVVLYTLYRGPINDPNFGAKINALFDLAGSLGITVTSAPMTLVYLKGGNEDTMGSEHGLVEIRIPVESSALAHKGTLGAFTDVKVTPSVSTMNVSKASGVVDVSLLNARLYREVGKGRYAPGGPPFEKLLNLNEPNYDYSLMETEIMQPIRQPEPTIPVVTSRQEVSGKVVLYTIYRGAYDGLLQAIDDLDALRDSLVGPQTSDPTLNYLYCPICVTDPVDLITEIQLDVPPSALSYAGTLGQFTDVRTIPDREETAITKPQGQSDNNPQFEALYEGVLQMSDAYPGGGPFENLAGYFNARTQHPEWSFQEIYTQLNTQLKVPLSEMPPVPALSPWGIVVVAALLAAAGMVWMLRKKKLAVY
jgi:hypothetical protein